MRSSVGLLVVSLALVLGVAVVGGLVTSRSVGPGSWYEGLDRAPWSPPSWLFGPAWTVLYVLMGVAAWLVAREGLDETSVRVGLGLYLVQLALNLGWTILFFGLRAPGWALGEILVLLAAIAATAVAFHRVSPAAAWLLAPYLAWVAFAATLNGWVALSRGSG
jgi:tryptophan-rich sensory protein